MWRKKKWIIALILAALVIVVGGAVGGVVYAQSGDSSPGSPSTDTGAGKTFADRVATILGIDQATVEKAFTQAEKDMQNEKLSDRLQSLVQQGKLTQEQADQYKAWWQSRPDVPQGLGPGPGPRGPMSMGFQGGFRCFPGKGRLPPPLPSNSTPSTTTQ
jgi:hypothetical protein